ncbi:26.5 kDa heat shock protein, mitochondrial-like [Nicotiana tabacum]|uniref:26.5 kDa heat shock protein, mitochondrial-like n=1 Tax=Nicotiana tabacum TaxID=4097 RepID=A0AC58UBE0_TOBAC
MSLARLALKNVQQRMVSSPSVTFSRTVDNIQKQRWNSQLVKRFSTADVLPFGLGNALIQASENINRLFENLMYDVPGLGKEDMKITMEDGILWIEGEHNEEQKEEGSNDELWS